ncbi:Crp/Fnr family transcriptional regulator [Sedimenticola selenatireducens]|uniref:Crp/Fnr family transcriptional regulator n=1 Tax=Sedimenticola selenatireducens TaxID=191960 RepID=A0A2N6CYQ0_9GAMM|nr:Crp/Fnr family transcriptional regulator [Sedimenticola selenatireducens]PLX62474.1 MAG: Crp/Fnr family transcriptional regulator [Sedimenticola selenatireducens]
METLEQFLVKNPWMEDLSPAQQQLVRDTLYERHFNAGDIICRKGSPTEEWVGIIDGLAKISCESHTGKQISFITGIPSGSWVGEGSLLKREPRRYDIVALRKSRIGFMPAETFFTLLEQNISFNRFLLTHFNERLGQFIGYMEYDRFLSPEARVARALASMFNLNLYPGMHYKLEVSQEELGNLSGISRQRVNQALHVLQSEKIVDVKYGAITILDIDALKSFEA